MDNNQLKNVLDLANLKDFINKYPKDEYKPIAEKGCEYLLNQIKRSVHVANVGKKQVEDLKESLKT